MHLQIQKITSDLIEQFKNYFPKKYLESLKNKQQESLVARFLISKLVEKKYWIKNFLPEVDENWIPVFEKDIFWSISHKKWVVFVAISKEKIWIDIEIIKKRDISLLNTFKNSEYKLLWWKNWKNFYVLWTAKEAIIKKNLGNLDDMKNLVLEKKLFKSKKILDFVFEKELLFSWQKAYFIIENNIVYSISFNFKNIW